MTVIPLEKQKKFIPLLLYPPLIEAIFELHWELEKDSQTGRLRDPSYPMMYGRLYERWRQDLPFTEDLPSAQVHPEASPYVVRHRIRKDKDAHPLVQIGPGVATVNEARSYSWDSFRRLSSQTARAIIDLYPTDLFPLRFLQCDMRFLNAVYLDSDADNPLGFLEEKLHMKIDVDPGLNALDGVSSLPLGVSLNLAYPIRKPEGVLSISAQLGSIDGRSAYILQTQIRSEGSSVLCDGKGFDQWILDAREVLAHCFLTLCKGELMKKFGGL